MNLTKTYMAKGGQKKVPVVFQEEVAREGFTEEVNMSFSLWLGGLG
jgi:hypothetical protein